jgi:hypothetical protein
MKDRNDPATIARCKETGKCQFIDVINIFLFTVSLYLAGTFKIYIATSRIHTSCIMAPEVKVQVNRRKWTNASSNEVDTSIK